MAALMFIWGTLFTMITRDGAGTPGNSSGPNTVYSNKILKYDIFLALSSLKAL